MARLPGRSLGDRCDDFLFAPADARATAIMRIALALMIAWSFWSVGMQPAPPLGDLAILRVGYDRLFTTVGYAALVSYVAMLFGLGWRPRLTGVALCVLLVPLASLSRGQQSRHVLLFALLAFSMVKSDACWSVRSWIAGHATREHSAGPMWPIRLVQLQLSIVYAMNAWAKSTHAYLSGDVLIGMSRMRSNFLVDLSDGHVHLGPLAFPVAVAAVASVIIESWLAIGFWFQRLRWITAVVGVVFHLGLQQIVHIFMLDYVSMFLYVAFLLPWLDRATSLAPIHPHPAEARV